MSDLWAALGLVLVLEGIAYALFPGKMREMMRQIPEIPVQVLRMINDMLKLGQGSVIELTKLAGESLEILANQKPIARGEVVGVNEKYGVRLTEVISPMERVEGLR